MQKESSYLKIGTLQKEFHWSMSLIKTQWFNTSRKCRCRLKNIKFFENLIFFFFSVFLRSLWAHLIICNPFIYTHHATYFPQNKPGFCCWIGEEKETCSSFSTTEITTTPEQNQRLRKNFSEYSTRNCMTNTSVNLLPQLGRGRQQQNFWIH